eukprot:NODE_1143_length_2030_cov_0.555153.p1 type:complete len:250 gc:universal NODE_1143_length_2030_cov_0.555153:1242-493(-)
MSIFKFFTISRYADRASFVQLKLLKTSWCMEMMEEFPKVLQELESSQSTIEGLNLVGSKYFCTGADLRDRTLLTTKGGLLMNSLMTRNLIRLKKLPFATYSIIDNLAIGGGSELCCFTDFRIMGKDSYIQFVHGKFGIIPGWGGTSRLLEIVGKQKALEILTKADKLVAEDCLNSGLADSILDHTESHHLNSNVKNLKIIDFKGSFPQVYKAAFLGVKGVLFEQKQEHKIFLSLWMNDFHKNAVARKFS